MSALSAAAASARRSLDGYRIALLALLALYVWLFTGLAWDLHAGMRTHKADLGQIDQAIWNSSRGRFVEMTDNGYIATRMTDHVEPILALISPVYWVWNDTRAMLLLQVLFVAAGAWLLYELTLTLYDHMAPPRQRSHIWLVEPLRGHSRPLGLTLAAAYLLAPQLQSALLTEFHAAPLAVPLVLWALLSIERRRWPQFVAAALLTALVKEEMALLAAGLGVWAVWREKRLRIQDSRLKTEDSRLKTEDSRLDEGGFGGKRPKSYIFNLQSYGLLAGAVVSISALLWFFLTTFVIVPAHAAEVYGVAESGYFQRYGALGDSPVDIFASFFTRPATVWQIAMEPARVRYVVNLLMVFGFLGLLAPEVLLLALPLFLANLLSAYPAQYYGEFHYSAPLIPYAAAAAAFGVSRLWRWLAQRANRSSAEFQHLPAAGAGAMTATALFTNARTTLRPLLTLGLIVWIMGWALFAYVQFGRGPLGGRFDPTPVTAHHRLLPRFTAQIPQDAAVTATAAVHPHVSHRRYVYQFPMGLTPSGRQLGNAEWALLDVTTNTDMAPGDLYARVQEMLAGDWGVIDGADGFLLLQKGASTKTIPPAFYDFARTSAPNAGTDIPLRLIDVEADDWRRWRQTRILAAWQVGNGYDPTRHGPRLEVRTPDGETIYRLADLTPPALLWYPPDRWQPGDRITVTTLPLTLPPDWGVAVSPGPDDAAALRQPDDLTLAATYLRDGDGLLRETTDDVTDAAVERETDAAQTTAVQFDVGPAPLTLEARVAEGPRAAGEAIEVRLEWRGPEGWPPEWSVFVHLRGPDGRQIERDGLPRAYLHYAVDERLATAGQAPDRRQPALPADAVPGEQWEIAVGLYNPVSGERAQATDAAGAALGGEVWLAVVEVGEPPVPDQACALLPTTCAAQLR